MLGGRDVEFVVEDRIAGGVFVDVGGAVADPLPRDKDRQFDVVLDLAHLERRRVPVPHQIVDEAPVLADPPGAAPVGDARRLHDRAVVAHVVDDPDKAVVEHRQGLVEDFLQRRHGGAAGRVGRRRGRRRFRPAVRGSASSRLLDCGPPAGMPHPALPRKRRRVRAGCRRDAGGPIVARAAGDARDCVGGADTLYLPCRATGYGDKSACGISVADPGAVPGASTIFRLAFPTNRIRRLHGGETGSTRVVKAVLSPGMIPPLSGQNLAANDNFATEALAA